MKMNYRYFLIAILAMLTICLIGCKKERPEVKPIEASHMIYDEKINSYMRILSRPGYEKNELVTEYSFTFFSHFIKLDGITGRYYNYYQVDWLTDNNQLDYSYHVFDYLDGAERNYSQNFHPYHKLKGDLLTNIKVQIDYEYNYEVASEIVLKEETVTYNEDILIFSENYAAKYENTTNEFNVKIVNGSAAEKGYTRYYLSFELKDEDKGHLDLQTWTIINDKVIPLYGLYHYQFNNGNYNTYGEGIDMLDEFQFDTVYCQINTYDEAGDEKSYFIKVPVEKKF